MGFRATFVTSDMNIGWPLWFRKKYANIVNISPTGCLSSKYEGKMYQSGHFVDLASDISNVLDEVRLGQGNDFTLIILYECGGIRRYTYREDPNLSVYVDEPQKWGAVDHYKETHNYGCGCGVRVDTSKGSLR